MKTNIEHFTPIGSEELLETNGGGFAYDFGRVIRFLSFGPFTAIGAAQAITDWQITTLLNNAENG